ncbi:MAG: lipopolysaccharide core heptose(I) kinase RfaP [Halioglobus sp.]|nr:lipopolysaccharide core heptose(I) kinase RfaP [Halioglobus sp.]
MTDYYLASGFAQGELARAGSAGELLAWARDIAAQARPADILRDKEGRKTLRFEYGGKAWFLKLHTGVGWAEVCKNLLQLRLPVVSARNEHRAVLALRRAGVHTLDIAAYARQGWNPARVCSMIVSAELTGTISLEHYCANWAMQAPAPALRMRLIRSLADSARQMHELGINHRDFYLCHFHLDEASLREPQTRCYLIDLHRAQMRTHTPRRWRLKDLAGLYFSAMDCGLTRRDRLRFIRHYSGCRLRAALAGDGRLWREVERQAIKLYRKAHGREPPALPARDH